MRKQIQRILIVALVAAFALSFAFAEVSAQSTELILGLTALTPMPVSPLANMDLMPRPNPSKARVSTTEPEFPSISRQYLNPTSLIGRYTPNYLGRDIRSSSLGSTLFHVSLFSTVALNIADYFSTLEALKRPGLQEGNVMMKTIVKSPVLFAGVKIGISAISYYGLKGLYKKSKPLAWIVSMATNFGMSYVVSNNMRLINSHPRAR
jgi:hypothetical protein